MNLRRILDAKIGEKLSALVGEPTPAVVRQATKPEFGHYQANGVMGAAKKLGKKPRDLAETLLSELDNDSELAIMAAYDIAGPGFINITLSETYLQQALADVAIDARLGISQVDNKQKYLVDYSSPNLAKEMHIGHLRTTAIGDANVRVLEHLGHDVIRANHVGDWGSQFGSLMAYLEQLEQTGEPIATALADLEVFYQEASNLMKSDEEFANKAREYVVKLQSGDPKCLALWERFIDESIKHCQAIYDLLDISLSKEDVRAESAYNDDLKDIVDDLERQDLIEVSDGAKCVFLDEFKGKDGNLVPAIIQKSDGGFPYMATDLAATKYRGQSLGVDVALYFVDGRQSLHFKQLYAIARAAGFINEDQSFVHVPFGTILNKEGKPFKTRDGGSVKLRDVVDEAVDRATSLIAERESELSDAEKKEIATVVGIGAIKYAELSKNRTTDYIFDWDTMLAFEGNTAPYLQYAYTRIRSIFKKANLNIESIDSNFLLTEPAEIKLATKLLQFPEAVAGVIEDHQANVLCNYLFELSGMYMSFYEQCPVLKSETNIRESRLRLCDLTARTLQQGLSLLGISTVEQM